MGTDFFNWGNPLTEAEITEVPEALNAFATSCDSHPACEVIGFARIEPSDQFFIILDIGDGTFELGNEAGILRVERIAIVYKPDTNFYWEVRPLRTDFPLTLHQNHVMEGEPRSLCLYLEDWKTVERTWTPESFLRRIFWWLRATADDTIHSDDQPIEQLFFESPYIVLLPRDHAEKSNNPLCSLSFEKIHCDGTKQATLRGKYTQQSENDQQLTPTCIPISITLEAVDNGPIEEYPSTLGGLQELVNKRGSDVLEPLGAVIKERVGTSGISCEEYAETQFVLVILAIPRTRNGEIERTDILGFSIESSLGEMGESLGSLYKSPTNGKWYIDQQIGSAAVVEIDSWKNLKLGLLQIQYFPSDSDIRSYSGLEKTDTGPIGIIAGLGSLGSTIAQLWAREAWGSWHYVDNDIIQSHNIARHIANHDAIGFSKTRVVRVITSNLYDQINETCDRDYVGSITDDNPKISAMFEQADILVDATTTLYAPRDLSELDSTPRIVSVFFTPSGSSSVMLLEDKQRTIRSPYLEAQYYRAILLSEWGESHLKGHSGQLWVGAGCRDISVMLSNELVNLHGATLARQVRNSISNDQAKIGIWDYDEETGAVVPYDIPVAEGRSIQLGQWRVMWDLDFEKSIQGERLSRLPNETGGMLLGIVDQKAKNIILVTWTKQPVDSISTSSSFIRGIEGQEELILECERRTAGIVSYIGEWHSHPSGYPANPSSDDQKQLASIEGQCSNSCIMPIMVIVAESSLGFCLEDDHEAINYA